MSISNVDNTRVAYLTDGIAVDFAYPYPFEFKSDIKVVQTTIATGVPAELVLGVGYTVNATNDDYSNGATITTPLALDAGFTLYISRNEALSQNEEFNNATINRSSAIEDAFERTVRQMQQINTKFLKTLKVADGDADVNTLPNEVDRASKILSFNSAGQPIATDLVAGVPAQINFNVVYGKEFWIDDYGADPTGVNDSHPAFVAAEALAAVAGGTVRIGVGHYAMGDECLVSDSVKVRGSGRMEQTGTSTILGTDVFPLDSFAGTRMFAQKTTGGTSSKGIAFVDMIIRGNKPGGGNIDVGIEMENGKYWDIFNMAFHFFNLQAIYQSQTGSGVLRIDNILARDCVQGTSLAAKTGVIHLKGQDNVLGLNIEATTSSASLSEGGKRIALLLDGLAASNFIHGGQYSLSEVGIEVDGSGGNIFLGTRSDLNLTDGWQFRVGGNTCAVCHSLSNGQETDDTYTGFNLFAQNNLLVGCIDRSQQANKIKYGFFDQAGSPGNEAIGCKSTGFQTLEHAEGTLTNFWHHSRVRIPNALQTFEYTINPGAILNDVILALPVPDGGGTNEVFVLLDQTQTLKNKFIDGSTNTLTNLPKVNYEFPIPLVQEIPEGAVGFPDIHDLVTASAHVSGMVLPDVTASTINFKTMHPIPPDLAGAPAARIEFVIMTKGAVAGPADVRLTVSSRAVGDTEDFDQAFVAETETTVTMPTTTETCDVYSQDMTTDPVAGDTVLVQLTRDPVDAADDFTDDIQIISATLWIKRAL